LDKTPIEEIYDGVLDGTVLGSGMSGVVRLVQHRETGVEYAVKCMDFRLIDNTETGLLQLRNEISIMCQLDHPNIVRIEEVYMNAHEIFIVQELCLGGGLYPPRRSDADHIAPDPVTFLIPSLRRVRFLDLYERLEQQENYHYTEAQCARMVKQMLSAVRYVYVSSMFALVLLATFYQSSLDVCVQLSTLERHCSSRFKGALGSLSVLDLFVGAGIVC
jgi:calcium-dependent protein kinase